MQRFCALTTLTARQVHIAVIISVFMLAAASTLSQLAVRPTLIAIVSISATLEAASVVTDL